MMRIDQNDFLPDLQAYWYEIMNENIQTRRSLGGDVTKVGPAQRGVSGGVLCTLRADSASDNRQ